MLIDHAMRERGETLLLLVPLPIFVLGILPMLLMAQLGYFGLCILGVLMICVGLTDGLTAHGDFNRLLIVHGVARPSGRARQTSDVSWATRLARLSEIAGIGLIVAGLIRCSRRGQKTVRSNEIAATRT